MGAGRSIALGAAGEGLGGVESYCWLGWPWGPVRGRVLGGLLVSLEAPHYCRLGALTVGALLSLGALVQLGYRNLQRFPAGESVTPRLYTTNGERLKYLIYLIYLIHLLHTDV